MTDNTERLAAIKKALELIPLGPESKDLTLSQVVAEMLPELESLLNAGQNFHCIADRIKLADPKLDFTPGELAACYQGQQAAKEAILFQDSAVELIHKSFCSGLAQGLKNYTPPKPPELIDPQTFVREALSSIKRGNETGLDEPQ